MNVKTVKIIVFPVGKKIKYAVCVDNKIIECFYSSEKAESLVKLLHTDSQLQYIYGVV